MPKYSPKYHNNHRRKPNRIGLIILFLCIISLGVVSAFVLFHHGVLTKFGTTKPYTSSSSAQKVKSSSGSNTLSSNLKVSSSTEISKDTVKYAAEQAIKPSEISLKDAVKPYWIHVSIKSQNLTIYDANNEVIESFICSTGSSGYDTPKGTFSIYNRGKSFYSQKYQEGAYYWVAFYKDYYIHSIPFDKNKNIIQSVANDLGKQDSHGCVHLTIPDSKWIYDNISNGTKVVVN